MLIYKITNLINNKCYIGQTIKTAEQRWKEHQSHAFGSHPNDQNKTLYKAIRKYGLENFTFEVLQDNGRRSSPVFCVPASTVSETRFDLPTAF